MTIKKKNLVVDTDKCVGCEICESVCSMVHDNVFNPINSRITRIRIEPVVNTALNCQFCAQPDCVKSCLLNALKQDPVTKTIHVDEKVCDGCGACIKGCQYGAIHIHTERSKAIFCDLCQSTPSKTPQCIEYCPKQAIYLIEVEVDEKEDAMETAKRVSKGPFPDVAEAP